MPYDICHDEAASYNMYHYPEGFEKQSHPGFFHSEYGHTRTILVGLTHDMTSGPGPDAFDASDHGRLNHMAQATPADHAIAITAYLIFLRRDILDQVLAMLFPV